MTYILNANTGQPNVMLANGLTELADTYPKKHPLNNRLTFASSMINGAIRKKYKDFEKFPLVAKDRIIGEAIRSALRFRKAQQQTRVDLSPSDEKGVRNDLADQSAFSMSNCLDRKKGELGEIEAARECSQELGANSFRNVATNGETFHTQSTTGSVISESNKGKSFSPQDSHTNYSAPNTSLQFGTKNALEKGKRAIVQATIFGRKYEV